MPMVQAVHKACGKPAFLMTKKPTPGNPAYSAEVRTLAGWPIKRNSIIRCESCGAVLEHRTALFDWQEI